MFTMFLKKPLKILSSIFQQTKIYSPIYLSLIIFVIFLGHLCSVVIKNDICFLCYCEKGFDFYRVFKQNMLKRIKRLRTILLENLMSSFHFI